MARRRRLALRLLLLLASVLVAWGLGEAAFRLLRAQPIGSVRYFAVDGPRIPPREIQNYMSSWAWIAQQQPSTDQPRGWLQPGLRFRMGYDHARWRYFDQDGAVTYRINSLGFRDLEFPVAKRPDEWRILALGDSFTFGFGVQLEDTWPQQLEQRLRAGRQGPVEVINGGFACLSFDCGHFDRWLEREGVRFQPDLVIVGFCLNDMGDVPMLSYDVVRPQPVLGSWLLGEVVRSIAQRAELARPRDMSLAVEQHPEMWHATQTGLRRLHAVLEARHVPLLVAVFPMLSELGERYPYARLHAMVGDFCRDAGIPCLDLLPVFRGRDEQQLWAHETDQHPNDVGQHLIATAIEAWLVQQRLAGR